MIYDKFKQSALYAEHLRKHPSHTISQSLFVQAKCSCIGAPHQRECADENKTTMRELIVAHKRLRLKLKVEKAACSCEICLASRRETALAAAVTAAQADAQEAATPAERSKCDSVVDDLSAQLEAVRVSRGFRLSKAHSSYYALADAVLCPRERQRDLELDDDETFLLRKQECAYGDCERCGFSPELTPGRYLRCPCEYTEDETKKVTLREYRVQPRTVRAFDDEGQQFTATKGVKELTEIEVTGKELIDKIEAHAPTFFDHSWRCTWANRQRQIDMRTVDESTLFIQTDFAAQIENSPQVCAQV